MEHKGGSAFAKRLVELRKAAGMRQEDVAKALQIHRTTYTKYETDVTTPDPAGLVRLASLFGVTVDRLVGRDILLEDMPREWDLQDGETWLQLDVQEHQLLVLFRRLNVEEREQLVKKLDEYRRSKME